MAAALAHLESLLRAKKLDVTLAHVRPPCEPRPALPTGREDLDRMLAGGLPRGELSELAGPRSSGRTTLMCEALASATGRGEYAALVDTLDRLDIESAARAGVALSRLLWVRGIAASVEAMRGSSGPPGGASYRAAGQTSLWHAVERAIKAFTLVLESRAFGLVACDLADVPPQVLHRLPFTTWFRLARLIEGSATVALLVVPERIGRSAGGLTIALGDRPHSRTTTGDARGQARADSGAIWRGTSDRARLFERIVPRARVVSTRAGANDSAAGHSEPATRPSQNAERREWPVRA